MHFKNNQQLKKANLPPSFKCRLLISYALIIINNYSCLVGVNTWLHL